jgi:hypothetical protein
MMIGGFNVMVVWLLLNVRIELCDVASQLDERATVWSDIDKYVLPSFEDLTKQLH